MWLTLFVTVFSNILFADDFNHADGFIEQVVVKGDLYQCYTIVFGRSHTKVLLSCCQADQSFATILWI